MHNCINDLLQSSSVQKLFKSLYGSNLNPALQRYSDLAEAFFAHFGNTGKQIRFFSSPGRSEIGGNHTDHNLGKVLAASINLDCIGAVCANGTNLIRILDISYNETFEVDIDKTEVIPAEKGSIALVRGILQAFKQAGYSIGGFDACFSTTVIAAAGVSSSASFEMILCQILNSLFNSSSISVENRAIAGQFAENKYWNKASGLLDQMACAAGGLVSIDFINPEKPLLKKIPFDFSSHKHRLLIVNTGKGHADLSQEYSAIPREMKEVAAFFGKSTLRDLSREDVIQNLQELRKSCTDRAVMRALHYFDENDRVDAEVEALENNDFNTFLDLVRSSGNSSWKYLQNVYVPSHPEEQSISIALALTENFISNHKKGSCRIHGGGFAGVILAFLPEDLCPAYTKMMEESLGRGCVYDMEIRPFGSIEIC
ncbi:MAG: galactokinase [Spirochaetaceae bacterium]|jgi:galactokinase|nr:galactokinase [Spirochaetaceae bacterium]